MQTWQYANTVRDPKYLFPELEHIPTTFSLWVVFHGVPRSSHTRKEIERWDPRSILSDMSTDNIHYGLGG